MPERVLVLGDGFIGKDIFQRLTASGHDVQLIGRSGCDLRDAEKTATAIDRAAPTTIVLTAAIVRLKGNHFAAMMDNIAIVENVLQASRGVNHLIFLSSIDVYGNEGLDILTPQSRVNPFDNYGASKLVGEKMIALAQSHGSPRHTTVLRLTGVFGPADRGLSAVSKLAKACRDGSVTLTGDGGTLRDFCFVSDLSRLVERCVEETISGTFNVACGESVTIRALAEIIRGIFNRSAEIIFKMPAPDNREYSLVFDQRSFYSAFPGFAFTPLTEAIAMYLEPAYTQV